MAPLPAAAAAAALLPRCCDECELAPAAIACLHENLLFCCPCSASLHSKRARLHHSLAPFHPCDHCESAHARLLCALCGGLAFCSDCASSLHSKKARAHHQLHSLHNDAPDKENRADSACLNTRGASLDNIRSNTECPPSTKCSDVLSKGTSKRQSGCDLGTPNSFKENPRVKEEHAGSLPRRNPKRAVLDKRDLAAHELTSSSSQGSDQADTSSSDEDESYGVKKYRKGSVTFEAFLVDADGHDESDASNSTFSEHHQNQAQGGVQERIRKMLELGLHPDTPDIEAQQALKNAQRLLTKHNLQQAEVMKGSLKNLNALKGGMRVVELRSRETNGGPGRFEQWIHELANIIAKYFDTQYYVQRHSLPQVVFYGIKQNADCAGFAFAATFNRIVNLSANYIPTKLSDSQKLNKGAKLRADIKQGVHSRVSRMSYRHGIVAGLMAAVKISQLHQKSTRNADIKESRERNDIINRKPVSDDDYTSDSGYSSAEDSDGSIGHEYSSKGKTADGGSSRMCQEEKFAAVSAIIVHSKKVGDDFLKEKQIKVREQKREAPKIWDGDAFVKGKKDSKTIDIGQKGITAKSRKKSAT